MTLSNTYLPSICRITPEHLNVLDFFYQGRDDAQHFLSLLMTNPAYAVAKSPPSPSPEAAGHTTPPPCINFPNAMIIIATTLI